MRPSFIALLDQVDNVIGGFRIAAGKNLDVPVLPDSTLEIALIDAILVLGDGT